MIPFQNYPKWGLNIGSKSLFNKCSIDFNFVYRLLNIFRNIALNLIFRLSGKRPQTWPKFFTKIFFDQPVVRIQNFGRYHRNQHIFTIFKLNFSELWKIFLSTLKGNFFKSIFISFQKTFICKMKFGLMCIFEIFSTLN